MSDSNNPFGEVIYSYSRKQAIEDGVLVDLTQFQTIRAHWRHHVACTDTVWNGIEQAVRQHGKDFEGIMHDISVVAKSAIRIGANTNTLLFSVVIGMAHKQLKLHIGPEDNGEPVLTLMLPHED